MGYQALATVDDVIGRAAEFTTLATVNPPNSTSVPISLALADATLQVNVTVWGQLARLAQTYLAAHFLSARFPQLALPAGPVSRDTVGEQESHYAVATSPAMESNYTSSRWGMAYVALQRQIAQDRFGDDLMGPTFRIIDKTIKSNAAAWKHLQQVVKEMRGGKAYAKAGVVGSGAATMHADSGLTNAQLAAVQHFGNGHIPARPFIAAPFDANRAKYIKGLNELLPKVFENKMTIKKALLLVGQQMAKDIREAVRAGVPPPNAQSTIDKKGSSKPLIDEGQLLRSVSNTAHLPGDPDEQDEAVAS